MASYGDQGYDQDFYESGYDMDGVQQQQVPPHGQQASWQQQAPAAAVHPQMQSQWSGAGQQQAYYPPSDYGQQQSYGQQGIICSLTCAVRMTYPVGDSHGDCIVSALYLGVGLISGTVLYG